MWGPPIDDRYVCITRRQLALYVEKAINNIETAVRPSDYAVRSRETRFKSAVAATSSIAATVRFRYWAAVLLMWRLE